MKPILISEPVQLRGVISGRGTFGEVLPQATVLIHETLIRRFLQGCTNKILTPKTPMNKHGIFQNLTEEFLQDKLYLK